MQPAAGARQDLPRPGELLLLIFDSLVGNDLLVRTETGLSLRLPGMSHLLRDMQLADRLLARVLATEPQLVLELQTRSPRSGPTQTQPPAPAAMSESPAMRLDQAVLRQISWRMPSAAELAASWRASAYERWIPASTVYEPSGEQPRLPPLLLSRPAGFAEPAAPQPSSVDRWLLPVYAWGNVPLMLRLVEADEEDTPALPPRRRRPLALRLELVSAALGRIVLQVQSLSGGILLAIAVEEPASAPAVRDALPAITAAIARAGLRIVRCRLTRGPAAIVRLRDEPVAPSRAHVAAEALSPGLFRALAEAAVILLQIAPVSRASR